MNFVLMWRHRRGLARTSTAAWRHRRGLAKSSAVAVAAGIAIAAAVIAAVVSLVRRRGKDSAPTPSVASPSTSTSTGAAAVPDAPTPGADGNSSEAADQLLTAEELADATSRESFPASDPPRNS